MGAEGADLADGPSALARRRVSCPEASFRCSKEANADQDNARKRLKSLRFYFICAAPHKPRTSGRSGLEQPR
jgi:hypothetical protein